MHYQKKTALRVAIACATSLALLPAAAYAARQNLEIDLVIELSGFDSPRFPAIGTGGHDRERLTAACRTATDADVAAGLCGTVPTMDRGARA